MELSVDHVTVAGRDLDALADAFATAGFPAEYGGEHSNGATHMSVVGFRDGSYVELISTVEPGLGSPWWDAAIHGDGGPCAWAVAVDDIDEASATLRERGVSVEGPERFQRVRHDGTIVEWDLTVLGGGEPGATFPFLISDRTPRERRVRPTGALADSPVVGVDTVVLGVPDEAAAIERLTGAFDLEVGDRAAVDLFDTDVVNLVDAPILVVAPPGDGWLAERLDRFGPGPVAYLLGTDPGRDSPFEVVEREVVSDREVGWIPPTAPVGRPFLGVVESAAPEADLV